MSKKEKILLKASIVFAAVFAIVPAANAMHIMEGYLPAKYCVAWGVVCLPKCDCRIYFIEKQSKRK